MLAETMKDFKKIKEVSLEFGIISDRNVITPLLKTILENIPMLKTINLVFILDKFGSSDTDSYLQILQSILLNPLKRKSIKLELYSEEDISKDDIEIIEQLCGSVNIQKISCYLPNTLKKNLQATVTRDNFRNKLVVLSNEDKENIESLVDEHLWIVRTVRKRKTLK